MDAVPFRMTVMGTGDVAVLTADVPAPLLPITALRSPGPAQGTAAFLGRDTVTRGGWVGVYGSAGYDLVGLGASLPRALTGAQSGGVPYTWVAAGAGVTDPRYLQAPGGAARGAYHWYNKVAFDYVVNCRDSATRKVSFYFLDWDALRRNQTVTVTDDATGAVLDRQAVSGFSSGVWLSWNVTGNVRFTFTNNGYNAVLSGVCFDGGDAAGPFPAPLTYRIDGGPPVDAPDVLISTGADAAMPYTVPFAVALLPTRVPTGSSVTFSARPHLFGTPAGDSAAHADTPAENRAGLPYLPDQLAGPRDTLLGFQGSGGHYYEPFPVFANLVPTGSRDWADALGTAARGLDPDGYPTGETSLRALLVSSDATDLTVVSSPYVVCEPGRYVLLWDGDVDVRLVNYFQTTATEDVSQYSFTGVNNRRVYDVTRSDGVGNAQLTLYCYFQAGKTLRNLRLFDRHVEDPLNPPFFHPRMVAQVAGLGVSREKDLFGIDGGCSVVDVEDCPAPTWATYTQSRAKYVVPWTRVEAYAPGQPYARDGYHTLVTFPEPHPFKAGQYVRLMFPSGGAYTNTHAFVYADGTSSSALAAGGLAYPTADPRKLVLYRKLPQAIRAEDYASNPGRTYVVLGQAPVSAVFARAVAAGRGCAPWASLPHGASDGLASYWGRQAAANVPDERRVYLEYNNEWWNLSAGFYQSYHCYVMGQEFARARAAAGDPTWMASPNSAAGWYYAVRSKQLFELFKAAWVDAGRDPSQLVHVFNSQLANPSRTADLLAFAATHDTLGRPSSSVDYLRDGAVPCTPDMVALGLYYAPGLYNSRVPDAVWDSLTVPQVADICDAYMAHYAYTQPALWYQAHKAAIAASPAPQVRLGGYEGGPTSVLLGGTRSRVDRMSVAVMNMPQARRQFQAHVRYHQDAGAETYVRQTHSGMYAVEGAAGYRVYSTYPGMTAEAGDGSANVALVQDASGNPVPPDPSRLQSVIGLAMREWAAPQGTPLAPGAVTVPAAAATAVSLSATEATGGHAPYARQWHRSESPGFTVSDLTALPGRHELAWLDDGLTPGTSYYYALAYTDADGATAVSLAVRAQTLPAPPPACDTPALALPGAVVGPGLGVTLPYHLSPAAAEPARTAACAPSSCPPVFDRVVVSRLIHGGTTVMFELVRGFSDAGPYDAWLEYGSTAAPEADDWGPVAGPFRDTFFLTDTDQRVFGTSDWGFYRVRLETGCGAYLSDPVNALGTLAWRDWNLAREVLRKERLLSGLAHEPGYLLKRRYTGPVCTRCVDRQTRAPRDPDCPVCYGTGFACGYFAPMPCVWAGLSPKASHAQLDGGAGRGTVDDDAAVSARMVAVPVLIDTDVWVSKRRDTRYFVHRVQNVAEWRGVPLVAQVELRPVPFTSVIYGLEIPGQSDPDDAC